MRTLAIVAIVTVFYVGYIIAQAVITGIEVALP